MIVQFNARLTAMTVLIFMAAGSAWAGGGGGELPASCSWGVARDVSGLAKFFLDEDQNGSADQSFVFGETGADILIGDWTDDDIDNIAIRRDIGGLGKFFFNDDNSTNTTDASFVLGEIAAVPVSGDWNGDGIDNVGVRRDVSGTGKFFLDTNRDPTVEIDFVFGSPADQVVVGNWDGDSDDNIGIVRTVSGGYRWFLANDTGAVAQDFAFGSEGDIPIVGDWDNDGTDNVGVVRDVGGVLRYFLDTNGDSTPDFDFSFGEVATDTSVACRFSGTDMGDEVGIARAEAGGALRWITTPALDGVQGLRVRFGDSGDTPFVGVFQAPPNF